MKAQEINHLATIVTRYSEVNTAAKNAKLAIQEVRFKIFDTLISEEEKEILRKAMRIVEQISSNTHQNDAIKYYNQIVAETENK